MKKALLFLVTALAILACADNVQTQADSLLAKIEQLYEQGNYKEALDSITVLRDRFPKAVEPRRKALEIWQKASMKMAQMDVMKTDSLLQLTLKKLEQPGTIRTHNFLRMKRDSLRGRYDAMCGVVRMIRKRMAEDSHSPAE